MISSLHHKLIAKHNQYTKFKNMQNMHKTEFKKMQMFFVFFMELFVHVEFVLLD